FRADREKRDQDVLDDMLKESKAIQDEQDQLAKLRLEILKTRDDRLGAIEQERLIRNKDLTEQIQDQGRLAEALRLSDEQSVAVRQQSDEITEYFKCEPSVARAAARALVSISMQGFLKEIRDARDYIAKLVPTTDELTQGIGALSQKLLEAVPPTDSAAVSVQ